MQRVVLPGGVVTWTVLDEHARVVGPAEEFLEFLRVQASSPNTVKSYARALALWWSYLTVFGLAWDAVTLSRAGGFLSWLRTGEGPQVTSIVPRASRFSESTISTRLRAVTSCYRFHEGNGVALGGDLVRLVHGGRAVYKPMLEHIARRHGRERAVVRVRVPRRVPPPVLTPAQIEAVCEACAPWDAASGQYQGRVRDRLLWALLAETGLRLGEALSLQHRDWRTGRGDTPFIEVVPRDGLPHGVRVKGQRYRRVFISDELDRLYGEYLWQLCDAGADMAVPDLDAAQVFVNLAGGTRFAPWRPDSVYDLVKRLRRDLAGSVPAAWTPHWLRHSHATALLLAVDGARGVPSAGSRGCADHAGEVRACDRGSRDAPGGRVACAGRAMADRGCRRPDRAMPMTRHLTSAGAPAAAGPGGPDGLWAQIPGGLRSPRLSPDTVPEEYRSGFRHYGDGTRNSRGRTPVDLTVLPDGLRKEITWCMFRIVDLGGVIGMSGAAAVVRMLGAAVAAGTGPAVSSQVSLLDASAQEWCQRIRAVFYRDSGRFPSPSTMRCVAYEIQRYSRVLEAAYDTRDWWQREVWRPAEDPRIPQRDHEPRGRESIGFTRFSAPWLRAGLQWFGKSVLETGQMAWSTLLQRVGAMTEFDAFLAGRGLFPPYLADDPAAVRALMRDYLAHVGTRRVGRGKRAGEPISASQRKILVICVEQFYAFMHDHAEEAAAVLAEPGWLRLGPQHAMLVRRGERPRRHSPGENHQIIDDTTMTKIMGQAGMLGVPVADGGFGDEQAMRLLMLQARLGRRINELCMLDHDPLCMLGHPSGDPVPGAFVARLRYQQTKIDGAPDTILVDAEVVAIIQAQRDWAARHFTACGRPGRTPRYLFLGSMMNRNGDRPYNAGQFRNLLTELAARSGIRDGDGRTIDLQRTHTFRHTAATSLLNAGVPLHVVQRWLGHLTPAMTMAYAQTLAETAEAEFLRYRKLTSDGRETTLNPEDLYDMLQLDQRTDRILPHGYCMLPPRQSCDRGNACLTCDKFVTDATFLPELRQQHQRTLQLIEIRQQAFTTRTGAPMSEDNIWLQGRTREAAALEVITAALEAEPGHHARRDGTSGTGTSGTDARPAGPRAVRGAGVVARTSQAAARATGKKGTNQA